MIGLGREVPEERSDRDLRTMPGKVIGNKRHAFGGRSIHRSMVLVRQDMGRIGFWFPLS
jgi:hypothetical protein